jgi:hypothetical protein
MFTFFQIAMTAYAPNFVEICGTSDNIEEYGRFQQHLGLIEDTTRVSAYFHAIKASADPRRKVAVDVGGGSGVLTLCALRNGYEKVYYVEPSRKIADYAAYNFTRNGVRDKVVIVNSVLEAVPLDTFAEPIDLIVHETISSLIVGFGCWPAFNALRKKMSPHGTIIPFAGKVFGFLGNHTWATRNESNDGVAFLANKDVKMDLYRHAFRSGGNVFDKANFNYHLVSKQPSCFDLVELSANATEYCVLKAVPVRIVSGATVSGLTTYWDIGLSEFDKSIRMDNRNPMLTSWFPYHIQFNEPCRFEAGVARTLAIHLAQIDAPYPFAFQVRVDDVGVTDMLYW